MPSNPMRDVMDAIDRGEIPVIWDKVFVDPSCEFRPDLEVPERKMAAMATAYAGWGCSHLDSRPEGFGDGLLRLGNVLGFIPTLDNLDAHRDAIVAEFEAWRHEGD